LQLVIYFWPLPDEIIEKGGTPTSGYLRCESVVEKPCKNHM
jgi:hypothetical protein